MKSERISLFRDIINRYNDLPRTVFSQGALY